MLNEFIRVLVSHDTQWTRKLAISSFDLMDCSSQISQVQMRLTSSTKVIISCAPRRKPLLADGTSIRGVHVDGNDLVTALVMVKVEKISDGIRKL
jgi:hypothetical protein